MKRYFYSLALALCALMLAMPVKAEQIVEVSNVAGLKQYLQETAEPLTVKLTEDIIFRDNFLDWSMACHDRTFRGTQLPQEEWCAGNQYEYQYVDEVTVAFLSVNGIKTLDLNGHTLQMQFYGDNRKDERFYNSYDGQPGKRVALFRLKYCGKFSIMDSKGGGQAILDSYDPGMESAVIYAPIGSTCSEINVYGGKLLGQSVWEQFAHTYGGVIVEEEGIALNLYGGKVNQITTMRKSHVNILGGEVIYPSGIVAYEYAEHPTCNRLWRVFYLDPDYFYFANGIIHGIQRSCVDYEDANFSACVPTGKKYFRSVNNTEITYESFCEMLKTNNTEILRIVNGDFVPVVVNGIGLSDENAGDILGDGGSVSWNEPTKTLTLRDAAVSSVVLNYTGNENLEYVIKVEGKSSVHGSGIKCTGAHLSIEGTEEDTLVVFGAGCKAIECDNQILLHNLYVDASATTTNAIAATTLVIDGAPLKAEAQSRAVACDISLWNDVLYTYNYTSGSATSAAFMLEAGMRKYKIWIAGKQLDIRCTEQNYFKSNYASGNIYVADNSRGAYEDGKQIILVLENASINTQSLYNGYSGLNPKGVPAIEIQEDSVLVIMDNVSIWSGDPTGVKYDGIDTRYYADGGHGIFFKPAHNNCELIMRSQTNEMMSENGSVYINTYGKNQSSYPIRCEGPRLYIECNGKADSIVVHSEREVFCKTGLTLSNTTLFSQAGFKTSNTPVFTTHKLSEKDIASSFIAWPRSAQFNSTGGVTGSTDDANKGILLLSSDSRHLLPITIEANDPAMGDVNGGMENIYGLTYPLHAYPKSGYTFQEWHIYRKGKAGYLTVADKDSEIELNTEIRAVAYFESEGGTPEEYPLWLKGTKVTSANCLDPADDGKSEYKHKDGLGQVTLNGVNWNIDESGIYSNLPGEVRVYCNGSNTIKGQSDWTLYFDEADIVRIYFDTLNVGFHEANTDDKGIQFVNTSNTAVLELRNKLTKITGNSEDHVAIITDTLKLIEGNELQVSGCGMEIRGGLVIPENYMIYPEGTYLAENGTMRDAENNEVRTFRIAPKAAEATYTITVESSDNTMGSVSGGGDFAEGELVTLTATPEEGYVFVEWSNGSVDNPFIAPACTDATITAIFRKISDDASIKALSINGKAITPIEDVYAYEVPFGVNLAQVEVIFVLNDPYATADKENPFSVDVPNSSEAPATEVALKVTAENGSSKTYTISVSRAAEQQGIDDINATDKAIKLLHNGQLFILRGDKIYTAQGVEVK